MNQNAKTSGWVVFIVAMLLLNAVLSWVRVNRLESAIESLLPATPVVQIK